MIEALIATALFALVCSGADRLRGTDKLPALASKALFAGAASLAVVSPEDGWWALLFPIVFIAGASYGWGRPLGLTLGGQNNPEPERWQVGPLVDNTQLALVTRGAMWLGPVSVLSLVTENPRYAIAAVAMTLAFTAAPYITNAIEDVVEKRWALMEHIRGGLFGALVMAGSYASF